MSDKNLSLDDIIKKTKIGMRGRGGTRRGGRGTHRGGAHANSSVRSGRVGQAVTDARLKIIEKNRKKLTDARDKLAEIAKQSDARLKLDKLRASQLKKAELTLSGISCKTGRNGRISLSTNKILPPARPLPPSFAPLSRTVAYGPPILTREPYVDGTHMEYNNDYLEPQALRRTVSNEYAPTPPPPPPVFNIKPPSSYTWVKPVMSRNSLPQKVESERTRDFKVVCRSPMRKIENPVFRKDWDYPTKSRTIVADDMESKYYDSRSHKDVSVKSRLDAVSSKPRTMGILARPKTSSSSAQSTGYRIVVSNLQANVTQEDIKELFEDVGDLLVSRLVRPGTAEVIYKTLKDAMKAVETYHNRQLDGHPMKCLLVNPRPRNNPTGPAVRPLTESRRGANASYVQPSLGAVHRALFDD